MHIVNRIASSSRSLLAVLGLLLAASLAACSPEPVAIMEVPAYRPPPPPTLAPAPAPTPVIEKPVAPTPVVGSAKGTTYHRPDCYWARKIRGYNRVAFADIPEATKKGYGPCNSCRLK